MRSGSNYSCVPDHACDAKDDSRKIRFCLFMLIFALMSIAVLSCTAIIDAGDIDAERFTEDKMVYETISKDTVKLMGCERSGDIIIPSSVEHSGKNYKVTSIDKWAFSRAKIRISITSVNIPDSVKSIEKDTFRDCLSLKSVIIGNGVESIGVDAFSSCSALISVTIGSNVTSIGDHAFYGCRSLTNVNFNSVNCRDLPRDNDVFGKAGTSNTGITVVFGDTVTRIPAYLLCPEYFFDLPNVKSVTIGSNVKTIGNHAFDGCGSLTEIYFNSADCDDLPRNSDVFCEVGSSGTGIKVVFGETVTRIPANLFYEENLANLPKITSVTIGNNVTSIGDKAFSGCKSLTSIDISNSVRTIGNGSFSGCASMAALTVGSGVTSIGDKAFSGCTSLTSVNIPNSVRSISNEAFSGCASMVALTVGSGVTSIGDKAFFGCTSLTDISFNSADCRDSSYRSDVFSKAGTSGTGMKVVFGDKVTSIPAYLFYVDNASESPKITSVTIGNSVKSIGSHSFARCTSLASVTIGNNVKSIGDDAFCSCMSLASMTIPDSVTSIGDSAFHGCTALNSITISNGVKSIGIFAFSECTSLVSATIGNSITSVSSNVFCGCTSLTFVTIPDSVTSIGDCSFSGCISLKSVKIGSGVVSIGNGAFMHCRSLASVNIPDSITSISNHTFCGCMSLVSVNIPDSVTAIGNGSFSGCASIAALNVGSNVTSIGYYAFSGCTSLTSVTISDSVKIIREWTFNDCISLTSVTIGKGVESISSFAFGGCSKLRDVIILRTETVTTICNSSFEGCCGLQSIYVPNVRYDDYLNAGCWSQVKDCLKPSNEISAANSDSPDGSSLTDAYTLAGDTATGACNHKATVTSESVPSSFHCIEVIQAVKEQRGIADAVPHLYCMRGMVIFSYCEVSS